MTLATFIIYTAFTSIVAEWRVNIRRRQNDVENARDAHLIDTLLNQENVKLFSNIHREVRTHEHYLKQIQALQHLQTHILVALSVGQVNAAIYWRGNEAVQMTRFADISRKPHRK